MTRCPPPLEALSQTPIKHNPFTCKLEHALEKSRSKQKIEQRMQEEGGRGKREEGGRTKEWWLPAYGLVAGVALGGSVAGQELLLQGGGAAGGSGCLMGEALLGSCTGGGAAEGLAGWARRGGGPAAMAAARNPSRRAWEGG